MSGECVVCEGEVPFIEGQRTFPNICEQCWDIHTFLYSERGRYYREHREEEYYTNVFMFREFPEGPRLFLKCKNCKRFQKSRRSKGNYCSAKCRHLDGHGIKATESFAHVRALKETPLVG